MSARVSIIGDFSNEQLEAEFNKSRDRRLKILPKHMIKPHPGFEIVQGENGNYAKLAYGKFYALNTRDIDIELALIGYYEPLVRVEQTRVKARERLKFHYRRAVSLISPRFAKGWNRWSDDILDLFISHKIHKVLWGSGNCGKSATIAMLLYTKWRVRPHKRMSIIASRVSTEAKARVFAYIKEIHTEAPEDLEHSLVYTAGGKDTNPGIYHRFYNDKEGKFVLNDRACIVSLPVKVSAARNEVGGNLLGRHPDDCLDLNFDECQEFFAKLLDEKIFLNWYTNKNLSLQAWGNPSPVEFHAPESHDLLYKLGAGHLSLPAIKKLEKDANKTTWWSTKDTQVLHLSMLDSPKDDVDERNYFIEKDDGSKDIRLHFLAGKDTVDRITESGKATPNSPAWFSQILGFPYIDSRSVKNPGVLSPAMINETERYPLIWRFSEDRLYWFMGVDPSVSGAYDACSIVVGRMGMMMDGRIGVEIIPDYCTRVIPIEGKEFMDVVVDSMHAISQKVRIPLKHIAVETHGTGDVLRYALRRHIEDGKWADDVARGENYHIVNPTAETSDRNLFKIMGHMMPAKEMVNDCNTEYWVAVRCAVQNRQLFNIPDYISKQFYNRFLLKNATGTKFKIEKKEDMRKRGVKSPNDADALCNMFELMRLSGFSYKFYNSAKYTEVYGKKYDQQQQQISVSRKLGLVSSILSLGANLNGVEEKGRTRELNIDTV